MWLKYRNIDLYFAKFTLIRHILSIMVSLDGIWSIWKECFILEIFLERQTLTKKNDFCLRTFDDRYLGSRCIDKSSSHNKIQDRIGWECHVPRYDKKIYHWINLVCICEDYAFLLIYGQNGGSRWVLQRKGFRPWISHE